MPEDYPTTTIGTVRVSNYSKYAVCVFCKIVLKSDLSIAGEHLCHECKDKFIKRLQLIMNFQ